MGKGGQYSAESRVHYWRERVAMDEEVICLNARKFEFLLLALQELTKPLLGKEKFRVIMEKDPESPDITVKYQFE